MGGFDGFLQVVWLPLWLNAAAGNGRLGSLRAAHAAFVLVALMPRFGTVTWHLGLQRRRALQTALDSMRQCAML